MNIFQRMFSSKSRGSVFYESPWDNAEAEDRAFLDSVCGRYPDDGEGRLPKEDAETEYAKHLNGEVSLFRAGFRATDWFCDPEDAKISLRFYFAIEECFWAIEAVNANGIPKKISWTPEHGNWVDSVYLLKEMLKRN